MVSQYFNSRDTEQSLVNDQAALHERVRSHSWMGEEHWKVHIWFML